MSKMVVKCDDDAHGSGYICVWGFETVFTVSSSTETDKCMLRLSVNSKWERRFSRQNSLSPLD